MGQIIITIIIIIIIIIYADDTYLIIPANNINNRTAEINNIESWSRANNLTLNLSKTVEIVFMDSTRKREVQLPSPMATITRVTSLKVLGVTINSRMSVSEHVSTVISSCAQSIRHRDSPSTRHEQQRPSTHLQICRHS